MVEPYIKHAIINDKPVINLNTANKKFSLGMKADDTFNIHDALDLTGGLDYFSFNGTNKSAVFGGSLTKTELKSTGTNLDALTLNATAGGVDINSYKDLTLDSATGDVYIQGVLWRTEYPYVSVTDNYSILNSDIYISADSTSQQITLTLPEISSCGKKIYHVSDLNGTSNINNIILQVSGSDTIHGQATFVMNIPYSTITIFNDKISKWIIR